MVIQDKSFKAMVGLDHGSLLLWREFLALPYGMVLVSGPAGAGKTTTLYASVTELVNDRRSIMTVEDPIEYSIEGIDQIQVNQAAGVDFRSGIRSSMQLNADIIIVDEIRDEETAKAAVNAALTGHLVLGSIQSNDSASAVARLLDLGVEGFLVGAAVRGVLAQRLVRKICTRCQVLTKPSAKEVMAYELEMQQPPGELWVGQGCNFCGGTGFSGRTGVFEIMDIDDSIRKLVAAGASSPEIQSQALANGLIPLRRAGMLKVKEGQTSLAEVLKNVFFIE